MDYGECDVCPVNEYAKETQTVRMCDKVCDCADGLMMLHRKLQEEERQKMDIGLTAAKGKVRTEFP
jgi:hypothetical protein